MEQAELTAILERFANSGWDVIALPSRAYLDGEDNTDALICAVEQADDECGSCGCEYDALYKRFLELKNNL